MKIKIILCVLAITVFIKNGLADISLLGVGFDSTRQLYKEYNKYFKNMWFETKGEKLNVFQSYGGSGKQARSVSEGLEADVVSFATAYDLDFLVKKGVITDKSWEEKFPHKSTPFFSTVVFVVRKGNPKKIYDWDDLLKDDITIITPNPKTSGGAKWNYLAAYGYALITTKDEKVAKNFVKKIYSKVPVLDSGSRGAVINFTKKGLGDVLITWESEAYLIVNNVGRNKFEIVAPSISVLAEPKIALIQKNAQKKGVERVALEYLKNMYSRSGQKIAVKNYFRPTDKEFYHNSEIQFPDIRLFHVQDIFGNWSDIQNTHFSDGGIFDEIYNIGG